MASLSVHGDLNRHELPLPTRPIRSDCGVKVLEFDTGVRGCEVPVCFCVMGIAILLPGGDFVDEGLFVWNAPVEALAG
jgi:hypothetical protein